MNWNAYFQWNLFQSLMWHHQGFNSFGSLKIWVGFWFIWTCNLVGWVLIIFHYVLSEGKELKGLILNDLYHHLQGELEGRKIGPGPFKELCQYLVESNCLLSYQYKYGGDHYGNTKDIHLYDLMRIRSDLGLNMWDYTDWKDSKAIAQTMLECFQDANSMVLLASSKLSALKALLTALIMWEDNVSIWIITAIYCSF